jgi:hypothetical protein
VTTSWAADPEGTHGPVASCRGCERGIRPAGETGLWEDCNGITVCVKSATLGSSEFVHHAPMPAGLRGAPESDDLV